MIKFSLMLIIASLLSASVAVAAVSVDILDKPNNFTVIEVTVDGCMVTFKVKTDKFWVKPYREIDEAVEEMISIAKDQAKSRRCHVVKN